MGLFWLFIYDASLLVANHQYLAGLAITLLLLCAVGSFFGIRYLSRAAGQPRLTYRPDPVARAAPSTGDHPAQPASRL
jgi:hypothetical protein